MLEILKTALESLPAKPEDQTNNYFNQPFKLQLPVRDKISSELSRNINALAVQDALEQKREQLFTVEEADFLWEKLSLGLPERDINYKEFKLIGEGLEAKYLPLFKANVFLQLSKPSGLMSIVMFFNYAIKLRNTSAFQCNNI